MVGHSQDAPLIFALLTILLLVTVISSLSSGQLNSKLIAVLGILAAVSAVLRLVPGPGGFSAIFFLPILAGYVYGPTFGFLLGSLGLAASALIGAGIGPWLPFQMFAAGWVGLLSGGLGMVMPARWVGTKGEVALLAVWGMVLGLGFGGGDESVVLALYHRGAAERPQLAAGPVRGRDRAPLCPLLRRHLRLVGCGPGRGQRGAHRPAGLARPAGPAPLPGQVPL